jgi:diaminopimelate epimerase
MTEPTIAFRKLSGSGNDFICLDNLSGQFEPLIASGRIGHLVRTLCRRGLGAGADGVILASQTDLLPAVKLFARFFDADGTEAALCGNGTACFVHWAVAAGWSSDEVHALTSAGVVHGRRIDDRYVRVCLPTPEGIRRDFSVETDGRAWLCDTIVMGVPHLVTFVNNVDEIEVGHWGRLLRRHPMFGPQGVNANFVQVLGPGRLAVRTFEFGVEDETLSCGTGSAAAAILAAIRFNWPSEFACAVTPVTVRAHSGDELRIYFTLNGKDHAADVCLETIVRPVYEATLSPEMTREALGQSDAGKW